MQRFHKLAEAAEVAFGRIAILASDPAIPFVVDEMDTKISVSDHIEMGINPIYFSAVPGTIQTLNIQSPAIVASLERPFLPFRSQKEALQFIRRGPSIAVKLVKVMVRITFISNAAIDHSTLVLNQYHVR